MRYAWEWAVERVKAENREAREELRRQLKETASLFEEARAMYSECLEEQGRTAEQQKLRIARTLPLTPHSSSPFV